MLEDGERKKFRFLVVDDEEAIRRLFSRILKRRGFDVKAARDGYEAIEAIKNSFFDFIFMDIKIPGINGIQTLDAISEIKPKIKAEMMTGYIVDDLIPRRNPLVLTRR